MRFALSGRVVVLTGAASGIGAALAQCLASRGADLALVDVDRQGLETVAGRLGAAHRVNIRTYAVDLADRTAIRLLPDQVDSDLGPAAVLINNAGIALGGTFEEVTQEQFDRVLAVNFFAPVEMVRAFLPQLRRNRPAHLMNLSSVFGLIGVPGQTAYCSSKFALRGFSEALREELRSAGIGVSVVHPGGVRTNIAKSAEIGAGVKAGSGVASKTDMDKFLRLDPAVAAERIMRGLERREKRILVGSDARALALLQRLMPVAYSRLLPH